MQFAVRFLRSPNAKRKLNQHSKRKTSKTVITKTQQREQPREIS